MKKIYSLVLFLLITAFSANSQDYRIGIGFRGGIPAGPNLKTFISETAAIDFTLGIGHRGRGIGLLGMFELHANAFKVPGLNWFYGGGAHAGFGDYYPGYGFSVGIDGVLGMEYTIEEIPISVAIEYKPYFNFIGRRTYLDEGAITLRYTIR